MTLDKAAEAAYQELIRQLPNATDLSDVHHNVNLGQAYSLVLPYDAINLRAIASVVRSQALEEAAKVAETMDYWKAPDDGVDRTFTLMDNRNKQTPERIAAAIRALKDSHAKTDVAP